MKQLKNWWDAAIVYRDRRVLAMIFLGFSSGLPFGVLADPLTAWLAESGVTKTAIGLFALVSLPYSLKFIWAPLMDRLPLPLLTTVFGRRRGWVLLTQVMLLGAILGMGLSNPAENLYWTALFAVMVAFSSASQDIVVDAYRVEILAEEKLAAGAATVVFGWRLGQVGSGAAGLFVADLLPWPMVFTILAALVLVGLAAILLNPEPAVPKSDEAERMEAEVEAILESRQHLPPRLAHTIAWFYSAVVGPFAEFMNRRGWLAVLAFILLYKFGDAVLGVMKTPFFLEIGFSKTEIAAVTKLFGFNAIIAGGILGGIVLARLGIMRGLLVCGVLMGASNLIFVFQALAGHDLWVLTLTIAIENITTGMGTTAFVAYLSSLCNVAYTATQYALLTSLMGFSRTIMSSGSGWLADQVEWVTFFLITTAAAVPGLLLLVWMIKAYPPEPKAEPQEAS
ncbi:MAG: AmpG family muropeptide MFS transporter [Rhodospirillales bacterium]|nr:AmpG family muropeptide MFS transporter [Rhodospirillales bacterium]